MAYSTGASIWQIAQTQIPWEQAAKVWGPLGVIFVLAVVGFIYWAKWHKEFVTQTMNDLRSDRDESRRLNERQANNFLVSLEKHDEVFEKGFDEVLHELRNQPSRRR